MLTALSMAPGVLVGLLLGGRIDRRAKRPLLIGADLVRAGLLLTVPLAAWLGRLGMGQLYVVAALAGAATTLFQIADKAYLPALIGKDRLIEGNSKLESTEAVAEIVGPGLGGLLVQAITAPAAIVFDALSFLASAFFLARIESRRGARRRGPPADLAPRPPRRPRRQRLPPPGPAGVPGRGQLGDLERVLRRPVHDLRARDPATGPRGPRPGDRRGGIGALFGATLAGRVSRSMGLGPALIACMTGTRIAAFLIPLARGPEWLALSCLLGHQLVGDGLLVAYYVLAVSLRQSVLPQATLGRANATFHVATGLLVPLGALIAGLVAEATDARTALWLSAIGGMINPSHPPVLGRAEVEEGPRSGSGRRADRGAVLSRISPAGEARMRPDHPPPGRSRARPPRR